MSQSTNQEQQHPQANSDREIVNTLLTAEPTEEYSLAELARLRIRYRGFPGAKDIQEKLDQILKKWGLTEEQLFETTRQIHHTKKIYKGRSKKGEEEDWS